MPHPHREDANPGAEPRSSLQADAGDAAGLRCSALRRGLDLFNHGYFWEAHEAWEEPWQGLARDSATALHLQALIRMAAAALKLVMEEPRGVRAHAAWCEATFARLQRSHPGVFEGGPPADALIALCRRLHAGGESLTAGDPPCLTTILRLPVPE